MCHTMGAAARPVGLHSGQELPRACYVSHYVTCHIRRGAAARPVGLHAGQGAAAEADCACGHLPLHPLHPHVCELPHPPPAAPRGHLRGAGRHDGRHGRGTPAPHAGQPLLPLHVEAHLKHAAARLASYSARNIFSTPHEIDTVTIVPHGIDPG
eukprot:1177601-Prorocentrum_minimum.AAC.2